MYCLHVLWYSITLMFYARYNYLHWNQYPGVSPYVCQPQRAVLSTWISLHIYIYSVTLPAALLSRGYILLLLLGYFPSPATLLWCIALQCHIFFSKFTCRWLAPLRILDLQKPMFRVNICTSSSTIWTCNGFGASSPPSLSASPQGTAIYCHIRSYGPSHFFVFYL